MGKTRNSANIVSDNNLFIDIENDRVGIGTTTPQYKVDVVGDINFTGSLNQGGSPFVASRWTTGTGDDIFRLNGDVGIGTTNPTVALQLSPNASISNLNTSTNFGTTAGAAATVAQFYHFNGNGSYLRIKATRNTAGSNWTTASTKLLQVIDVTEMGYVEFNPNGSTFGMAFGSGATELVRLTSAGNFGIGLTNPGCSLEISGGVRARGGAPGAIGASNNGYAFSGGGGDNDSGMFSSANGNISFYTDNYEAVTVVRGSIIISAGDANEGGQLTLNGGSSYTGFDKNFDVYTADARLFGSGTWTFQIFSTTATANLSVQGALSKGSGSFKIDHPLEELSETHHLVHSFIEGPKADLIYRGKTTLISGISTINIDEVSDMTNGTFVALCREVQCFTTNETGWTAIKGSVTGNLLTIQAQDLNCIDTISWMVIGERKDKHMYETEWTNDDGKVIVEPLKKIEINT